MHSAPRLAPFRGRRSPFRRLRFHVPMVMVRLVMSKKIFRVLIPKTFKKTRAEWQR
jgi:hypothetical protein